MKAVYIQNAVESDVSEIQHLLRYSWQETYRELYSEAYIHAVNVTWNNKEKLSALILDPLSECLVAKVEGLVVGVLYWHLEPRERQMLISKLYVRPNLIGSGLGSSLLARVINKSHKSCLPIVLEIDSVNINAISFFIHNGFKIISEVKENFEDIESCQLVLRREAV